MVASLKTFFSRLRATFSRRDEEFEREIQFHLAMLEEEGSRQSMSAKEALDASLRSFGNVSHVIENNRENRGWHALEVFFQDIRYAARMMRKNPGFTAVAVLTLALGIGANTAMFSVVQGVVLAPLPYDNPDRLVILLANNLKLKHVTFTSYPDFLDWQRNARSFTQMAARRSEAFDLTYPGPAEHLEGERVSSGFFSTLGVKLALGREFLPEEDKQGTPAAIISDSVWRERFGASQDVPGKSVTLSGKDYTIVGILPPKFQFWTPADVYVPLGPGDPITDARTVHAFLGIARIKPGVSVAQAQAEMNTVQENIDQANADVDRGLGAAVWPMKKLLLGDVSGTLFLLLGAVGIVLLIACANVANLLLARSAARRQEFAVRVALGARRGRIAQQLITESVLLSLVGGGLGLAAAKWGLKAALAVVPGGLPRSENIGVNGAVLLFAFAISIVVGILFSLAPALKGSQVDLHASLKRTNRVSAGGSHRTQSGLVMGQMALTLVLLAAAGLLIRTIRHLWEVNPGFSEQHIVTFKVGLSPSLVATPVSTRTAYQQLMERIRQVPGIQSADLTTLVPLSPNDNSIPFWIGSQKPASIAEAPRVLTFSTGQDYLQTMGIPLLRGRFFTPEDTVKSELVMVIDSELAHKYFRDRDALGQTLSFPTVGPFRIIGVVGHVRHYNLGDVGPYTSNQAYTSFYQIPDEWLPIMHVGSSIVVRTPLDLQTLMPAVKAAAYGTGSDQPVYGVETMQEIVSQSLSTQNFPMVLLATFAGVALLLASVGIYGVISYLVTERVREIGIRMALGAKRPDVLRMVIGQGLGLAAPGVVIGAVAALLAGRLLSSFSNLLYGVRAGDPVTLVVVALVLLGAALLACYVPARRAAGVDPMVALRSE